MFSVASCMAIAAVTCAHMLGLLEIAQTHGVAWAVKGILGSTSVQHGQPLVTAQYSPREAKIDFKMMSPCQAVHKG